MKIKLAIFLQEISFDGGTEVRNYYDNLVNENDEVIVYIEVFVSNDGNLRTSQVCNAQLTYAIYERST